MFVHRGHVSQLRDSLDAIRQKRLPESEVGFASVEPPAFFERYTDRFDSRTASGEVNCGYRSNLEVAPTQTKENSMQKITPFLWFNGDAEEAANFYISIFKHSKVGNIARYGEAGPGRKGSVMSVTFQIEGQDFIALNDCQSQEATCGKSSRRAEEGTDAVGSKTNSVCPGRSSRRFWVNSCTPKTWRRLNEL